MHCALTRLITAISSMAYAKGLVQRGFSLIEMATVMIVMGIVITPAATMYHQHRVEKDWDEVKDDLDEISIAIGRYRAVYGRYPRPAPVNAKPGDADYGFEIDSTLIPAPNACSNGTCTFVNNVPVPAENVLIGSLPFKTLNLQEVQSIDSYKNRYSYIVTQDLTDNTSFDLSGGGISVLDSENPTESLIFPAGKAHFVVISHGKNGAGAVSRGGSIGNACGNGSAVEQENCDPDSDFIAGSYDKDVFDDRVTFFTSVYPAEWQVSATTNYGDAIHLKNTDSIAIGASMSDNLGASKQATVRTITADTGSIYATTNFVSEQICTFGGTSTGDCFGPEQIAGNLHDDGTRLEAETTSEGMSCYTPSTGDDYYMAGVANNKLLCTNEIFSVCPKNMFITGIDANGKMKCSNWPGYWCEEEEENLSCHGKKGTIPRTSNNGFRSAYSGLCKMATDYDRDYFAGQISSMGTKQEVKDLVKDINNEPRTVGDCGADSDDPDTQVKNIFQCKNGTWEPSRKIERGYYYNNFPGSNYSTQYAETPGDCTCKEDYRYREVSCGNGYAGTAICIDKHPCPQTYGAWRNIYCTDLFCGCVDGSVTEWVSCDDYYDEHKPAAGTTGLTGRVLLTYALTCDADGNSVRSTDPTNSNTDECACEVHGDITNRTNCNTGFTNDWSWTDPHGVPHTEKAVESLVTKAWLCPGTTITDTFSHTIPDPGYYGASITHGPKTCNCDVNKTEEVIIDCSVYNKRGTGMVYEKKWDCTLINPNDGSAGWWEPQADWDLDEAASNCNGCSWQSAGDVQLKDVRYGGTEHEIGMPCSCNSDTVTPYCNERAANEKYKIWTACPCVTQTGG